MNSTPKKKPVKRPGRGRVGKAGRLSRERVLEAGLVVVRSNGLDGLTMRSVAQELGCGLMSLYHHVEDRSDLLKGLIDSVAEAIQHPDHHDSPSEELAAIFIAFYSSLREDAWVARCLIDGFEGSPLVNTLVERAALSIEGLGYEGAEAGHVFYSLLHYTFGEVLVMASSDLISAAPEQEQASSADFPATQRTIHAASMDASNTEPFEENLRRLISALTDRPGTRD